MTNKDIEKKKNLENEDFSKSNLKNDSAIKNTSQNKFKWKYCPYCGEAIPNIENLRYCMNCGIDLKYLYEKKEIPPDFESSYVFEEKQIYYEPVPYLELKPHKEKISKKNISYMKNQKLWGIKASLFLPLLAFTVMNLIVIGILFLLVAIFLNITIVYGIVSSPAFLMFTLSLELILIIFPITYVRHLFEKKPSIKTRLELFGLTRKGYNNSELIKEITIGFIVAIAGIILVASVIMTMEVIVEFLFGIEIVRTAGSTPTNDVDLLISGADILILVILVLMMFFIVGISEEILFRGFMQKGLVRNIGKTWGIIITAIIFSLIHLITIFIISFESPTLFVILFLLLFFPYLSISLLLGLVYNWRNENLIAVIIAHGAYDAFTIILAFIFYGSY
ncbi:MAG: lysostaphin resistance A-like protein [Promethearchaeota archaeon]